MPLFPTAPTARPQELTQLTDGAAVYKLIGPALVKQEGDEAAANVRKRLEFIDAELKRLDGQLAALEEKQGKKQAQVGGRGAGGRAGGGERGLERGWAAEHGGRCRPGLDGFLAWRSAPPVHE